MTICYQCGCLVARYRASGKMVAHKLGQRMCYGSVKDPRQFMYPFEVVEYHAKVRA